MLNKRYFLFFLLFIIFQVFVFADISSMTFVNNGLDEFKGESQIINENLSAEDIEAKHNLEFSDQEQYQYGILFIWETFLDPYYILGNNEGYPPAFEKSIMENYFYMKPLKEYASEYPITIAMKTPLLNFINSYKENKFWEVCAKDIANLTIEDKTYIIDNFLTIPTDFPLNNYPRYKELLESLNYGVDVSSEIISALNESVLIDLMVWHNIAWSNELVLDSDFAKNLLNKQRGYTYDDLKLLIDYKQIVIQEACNFFKNLPIGWNHIIYPYYEPYFSLFLNKNLLKLTDTADKEVKVNWTYDGMWHIAKAFKSFRDFGFDGQKAPTGIISDIGFVNKDIFKILAIRDYEIFINKTYLERVPPGVLESGERHVCVLYPNVFFDLAYYDLSYSIKDFLFQVQEVLENNMDAVCIWDAKEIEKYADNSEVLRLFFKNMDVYFEFKEFKDLKDNLIKKVESNEKKTFDISKHDYVIRMDNELENIFLFYKDEYLEPLIRLRKYIELAKNKGKMKKANFNKLNSILYKLQSRNWLQNIQNKKIKKQIDKNFFNANILLYQNSNIPKNLDSKVADLNKKKVRDYSKLVYFSKNKGFDIQDSLRDDYGPGSYTYPLNDLYPKMSCDIRRFSARNDSEYLHFSIFMNSLSNPFDAPNGFSAPQIDIYIDMNGRKGLGNTALLKGRGAFTTLNNAWEYCISINGWKGYVYQSGIDSNILELGKLNIKVNQAQKSINIYIPKDVLTGNIVLWNYIVLVCGYDHETDSIMSVKNESQEAAFGGRKNDFQSNIIDIILPTGVTHREVLSANNRSGVEIPAFVVSRE
ncbi:glucodextranase DOMON-like domain-containing protein [bacterium]